MRVNTNTILILKASLELKDMGRAFSYQQKDKRHYAMAEILQVYVQRHQYYAKKGLIQRR
jgi:hypothetical protein